MDRYGQKGDRVELIRTSDPHTGLRPGAEGVIAFVDSIGTRHVDWADGSKLGLVPREDEWRVVERAAA